MVPEPISVTLRVTRVLDDLGIPYLITGSLAGAVYGVIRATADADMIAAFEPEHVDEFVRALTPGFYVDAEAIRDAIRRQSSFNVVHLDTMFKVDIFVRRARPFDDSRFSRRSAKPLAPDEGCSASVATAEDLLLAKLDWYRLGNEVSERQWRDVVSLAAIQSGRLDTAYLRKWAAELGVTDLLDRALS